MVDEGAEVKYIVPEEDKDDEKGWTEIDFDDSKWEDGISGVGYSDGDDNTQVPGGKVASIYTRYYFDVGKARNAKQVTVRVDYDDGYILWLNGVEIVRSANILNLSKVGDIPKWDVSAPRGVLPNHGATQQPAGKPNKNRAYQEAHDLDVEYGGQDALSVDSRGKLTTTWGSLKKNRSN